MQLDEFSFLNQQLAGMLASGIPLEAALLRVCSGMRRQRWRSEFEKLRADLAQGTPLDKALDARKLPDLYRQMVKVGAKSNDLPGLLTLLADHYQKTSFLWTRLKGLMIYPVLVLLTALGLSLLLASQRSKMGSVLIFTQGTTGSFAKSEEYNFYSAGIVMPVIVLVALSAIAILTLVIPALRRAARWWLPGFKEAHLSRLASAMSLLLKGGVDLGSALGLMRRLESGGRIQRELAMWESELSKGGGKLDELGQKTRAIPPLFFWLVAGEGENLPAGFTRAAEIYYARAMYKMDLLLNSALPISVVGLGLIIMVQVFSTLKVVTGVNMIEYLTGF